MNDFILKNRIREYLNKHPLFDFSKIRIFVYKGNVTLKGLVSSKQEKFFAELAVKQIREVKNVFSKLELISEAITLRLPPLKLVLQS
jgi:osmotically-inducible protein OsmY